MLNFFNTRVVILIIMALSVILPERAYSQGRQFTLSGVVWDTNGETLPGVSVRIKGTLIGTISDSDGKYSISVPNEESVLVASFIGYKTIEMAIGKQSKLDFTMSEDISEMKEVIVVGYGVQKKESLTGAISSVGTKELLKSSSTSLANSLAGRISGLSSTQSMGGQPGVDNAKLYLRGAGTMNTTDPLILIDGIPRDNIRTIDPNEVESVSVLKDASATAVFGVRGANGVILITTKRGESGKAKLSLSINQSYAAFTRKPDRLHSVEYLNMRSEARVNDGISPIDPNVIALYENPLLGLDPNDPDYASKAAARKYLYPDNDYYGMVFKDLAAQTTINANISGGTKNLSYFLNAGFIKQGGHLETESKSKLGYDPSSRMERWSFRANLDYKISNSLKAFLNLGSYIEKVGMPSAWQYGDDTYLMMRGTFFYTTLMLPISPGPTTISGHGAPTGEPVIPAGLEGERYMPYSSYETVNRFGYWETVNSNLNSTLGFDFDLKAITPGLSVRGMLSYDSFSGSSTSGVKRDKQYEIVRAGDNDSFSYSTDGSEIRFNTYKGVNTQYKINAQAIINYNRTFNSLHNVGATFVAQRDSWESTGSELPYNMLGIASRMMYNYDNRYFAEFNMGYNGSEQFSPKKRFGFFPAASLGWVISNEGFLKDNKIVPFLKLRGSYGKVGNDKQGDQRFLYVDQTTLAGGGGHTSLGQGSHIIEGLVGNYNVTWETASKYNIGIDFNLFNDLTGSVDIFNEKRKDILIRRETVPGFVGIAAGNIPRVNMGEVDNKGVEFEISYNKKVNQDLLISIKGNLGFNKNTVKYADEIKYNDEYAYTYRKTGYSLGQNFGYLIDKSNNGGYWTKEALANTDLIYDFTAPRPGDFVYQDLNGDGHINEEDMAPIGNGSVPRRTYGITLGAEYKGFDFSVFFQGLGGYNALYAGNLVFENIGQGSYYNYHRNAWTEERWLNGDKIEYPALSTRESSSHQSNSFFIQDKSFIRLKNIELGYTFPPHLLRKIGISNLRVFVGGQNLITWTKLKMDHLDPEPNDPMSYPVTKTFSFGTNISF